MAQVVKWAGIIFLAVFAIIWFVLSWQVFSFDLDSKKGPLEVSSNLVIVAGFLATTVGTATAAWLGIEIQKPTASGLTYGDGQISLGDRLKQIMSKASVVTIGCWTYLAVAVVVLLLGLFKSDAAPQVYQTFLLSGLGWLAGAFAAAKPPA